MRNCSAVEPCPHGHRHRSLRDVNLLGAAALSEKPPGRHARLRGWSGAKSKVAVLICRQARGTSREKFRLGRRRGCAALVRYGGVVCLIRSAAAAKEITEQVLARRSRFRLEVDVRCSAHPLPVVRARREGMRKNNTGSTLCVGDPDSGATKRMVTRNCSVLGASQVDGAKLLLTHSLNWATTTAKLITDGVVSSRPGDCAQKQQRSSLYPLAFQRVGRITEQNTRQGCEEMQNK